MSNETEDLVDLLSAEFPVLPLRDIVVYPNMVIPLFVGREKSIKALEAAMLANKKIFLVAQRQSSNDDPDPDALFNIGTISSILQLIFTPLERQYLCFDF